MRAGQPASIKGVHLRECRLSLELCAREDRISLFPSRSGLFLRLRLRFRLRLLICSGVVYREIAFLTFLGFFLTSNGRDVSVFAFAAIAPEIESVSGYLSADRRMGHCNPKGAVGEIVDSLLGGAYYNKFAGTSHVVECGRVL